MGGSNNKEGSAMAKVAAKVAAKAVPKSGATEITKTVKMPLMVTMTGSKEALSAKGEDLVAKLRESLPMTMRLGRGQKETITINAK
jgi:hypothetical protein